MLPMPRSTIRRSRPRPIPATRFGYEDRDARGSNRRARAIDVAGTGQIDLLAWSPAGIQLYRRGATSLPTLGLAGDQTAISAVSPAITTTTA